MTDVHSRDRAGRTPLHYAVIDGPRDQVNAWQETDPVRIAELHQISVDYRLANTRHLIDSGANVNATDDDDCTPLHSAVAGDSAEVVRYLLDSGAYVDARNNKGETPLKLAVRNTTPAAAQIMAVLYAAGADPTIQADNGKSALDFVRRYGKPEERAVFNLD
ncbi:Putative ankyrin-like protein [Mycobacteroides abscessus]|uniref:ankyrin repeat domain-containing protein n=1 Tax=Mycobacteroides abscessus TaxID=36809 RepID=UPI0005E89C62|nr:ankyrin repeat domain-containing protein [Mycobacteroides abscessus]CPT93086.1 Putative ankyrin-like protein [Mycobacteroides abscessus]CPW97025.1 Putative ankyrin-like protein [Mycobacteroides abscessus]